MKTLKRAMAILILAGLAMALSAGLFAHGARAHADFESWANRSARVCKPCQYATKGTAAEQIVSWNGTRGIGNVGIGNGNYTLMDPDFINDAIKSMRGGTGGNETNATAEAPRNETISAPQDNAKGNGTLTSAKAAAGGNETVHAACETCGSEAPQAEEVPLTESLTPDYIMAGGVIREGVPYSVAIGSPFPHILNEKPVEPGVLYGKMFGLPLPDGSRMDIGIKSPGYEY